MNTRRLLRAAVLLVFLGGVGSIVSFAQKGNGSIVGVWRVAELTRTGPNAGTNSSPEPGIYIFTATHYSVNMVTSNGPRPDLPTQNATDKQRADAFGPFTANAGTYVLNGNELKDTIMVAKNPNIMKPGGFQTFVVKMEGKNTLWLTQKANTNGPEANPGTVKLTRIE